MEQQTEKVGFFSNVKNLLNNTVTVLNKTMEGTLQKSYGSLPSDIVRIALDSDPQNDAANIDYIEKNNIISYESCRQMAEKDIIVASIVTRRTNQIAMFGRPSSNKYTTGFKITTKKEELHGDEKIQEIIDQLTTIILNTGLVTDDRPSDLRNSFERWLRLATYDILVYDALAQELIYDQDGKLFTWLPVAADTIRYANSSNQSRAKEDIQAVTNTEQEEIRVEHNDEILENVEPQDVKYVQVYQGRKVAAFTENELFYSSFTPTNWIYSPYSTPILEKAIRIVKSHLFAESHNMNYFTHAGTTKGMLVLRGNMANHQVDAFRRQLQYQMTSAKNAWRMPVLSFDPEKNGGIDFVPIQMSNLDMDFSFWMAYLVKCLCAVFLISPSEIGWGDEAKSPLIEGSGSKVEKQISTSRDNGLRPILNFIEDFINQVIFKRLGQEVYENFKFEFVGMNSEDESMDIQRNLQKIQYMSINEIRALNDLPKCTLESADVPNPTVLIPGQQQIMMMQGALPQQEPAEKALKIEYYNLKK